MKRIAIIGAGPVGLVTGTALANVGHRVQMVEIDRNRAQKIASGEAPFYEPRLAALLAKVHASGALTVTDSLGDAVGPADLILICVGTPSTGEGADLSALEAAAKSVGCALRGAAGYRVVAVKSTVPPGTTSTVVEPVIRQTSELSAAALGVAMNPEFLREGLAVEDAIHPDRVVLGVPDARARELLESVYTPFNAPMVFLTPTGAEMAKYTSNALLATLVSFSNEIAAMCESIDGADAVAVLRAVHMDRRFRPPESNPSAPASVSSYLLPGLGYGGSCFPKDTTALAVWARARGVQSRILDAVRAVNAVRPAQIMDLLAKRMQVAGARVTVLGLAFKPDTDDLRESRSLDLVRLLAAAGAEVRACDPMAAAGAARLLNGTATVTDDPEVALKGADAAILATAWPEYISISPARVQALMRRPLVVDTRRALDAAAWAAYCDYVPIGIAATAAATVS